MSNITKDQVIEWLSSQSVLELAALVKDLEGKWGVSAAAAVAAAPAGAAAGGAAALLPLLPRKHESKFIALDNAFPSDYEQAAAAGKPAWGPGPAGYRRHRVRHRDTQ